jgi:hypothetical protein
MRASVLMMVFALTLTVSLRPLMGQNVSDQQKHLTAIVVNGWANMLSATSIERGAEYPTIIYLKGNVEVKAPVCPLVGRNAPRACDSYMILHADSAEFHEDTGQIEAHGNVNVVPLRHETGVRPPAIRPANRLKP